MSESIEAVRAARGGLGRVAVVGLGTGSLACHRRGHEDWTFFEIDPDVVRIARDPRFFSFLSSCAPGLPVVLGDARLTLAASPERYDLIVLDAFSSDVIPVHLLTREAVAGYLARLNPEAAPGAAYFQPAHGAGPVVAAVGAAEGLVTYRSRTTARRGSHRLQDERDCRRAGAGAAISAICRRGRGWREVKPDPAVPAWTDDYSNIRRILRKKLVRKEVPCG